MLLRQLFALLILSFAVQFVSSAQAEQREWPPYHLYQRTSRHYGQPPTYPRQLSHHSNTWYQWGSFGAYDEPRTHVGGHYSHRDHYHEIRFSAPR